MSDVSSVLGGTMHTRTAALATIAVLGAATLTACSSNTSDTSTSHRAGDSAAVASQPSSAHATVRLVWTHTSKDDSGDTAVTYVARVSNPGSSLASVAIDARALDKTGTIVGSAQETLPNLPAHATLDFLGTLGGADQLTGTPAKIDVTEAKDAFGMAGSVQQPMLATSELKLTPGSPDDLYTDEPNAYDLTVKVTNNTHDVLKGMVTQQVVLYDAHGKIVGGDTGMSDNVPDNLPAGMSYREQWTDIPATAKATRAVYTVWPG